MTKEEILVDLESLGFKRRLNPFNTEEEISNLIENIKKDYVKDYKEVYCET